MSKKLPVYKPILGDPATGEAPVTLADGVKRVLRFDFHAFRILEELTGMPFHVATERASLAALLFAGLHSDAKNHAGDWSLEALDRLGTLESMPKLTVTVRWALGVALEKMESGAKSAVGEMKANASRGDGTQR